MDYKSFETQPRLLLEATLRPAQGHRFQPTGFADLGPAVYTRPCGDGNNGVQMLLVESAQSVANRLEKTCLDGDGPDLDKDLKGLPYVAATLTAKEMEPIRTSSLVEAHRLASPYFLRTTFGDQLVQEMACAEKGALNWGRIYRTLFKYDPNALIHGVFLSLVAGGRVRVPRAVSGFIEAEDVQQVTSGGVKNSAVDPTGELQVAGVKNEKTGVYSNVPYPRIEFTARTITAFFNVDLALIRGYGLPEPGGRLLIAVALLKIRRFLTTHLRLRTACDLLLEGAVRATAPEGFVLPEEAELLGEVKRLIGECKGLFADPPVTELKTAIKIVKKKAEDKADAAGAA